MKKLLWITLVLIGIQEVNAQAYYKFVVFFKDKNINAYPLDNPAAFLSTRAIQRREKANIQVTLSDVPVNPQYINQVLQSDPGFEYLNRSRWMNSVMIATTDSAKIGFVAAMPMVQSVQWVYKGVKPQQKTNPDKAGDGKNGGSIENLDYTNIKYGISERQNTMLGMEYLHKKGFVGQGLVIAVLDAGFSNVNNIEAFDHIRQENRLLGTWDFVTNETSVYEDNSHGTNVLGAIAGFIPGEFIGTGPGASFWLLRSEDAATETIAEEYNWVAAAEFADSVGADIINSSLGYTTFDEESWNHSYSQLDGNTTVITRGADMAASKGILVVNSAGNSGSSGWHYIGAPADGDSVLAIGAVDDKGAKAGFSSFGPSADNDIKPNVSAMGQNTAVIATNGAAITGNGTSFSSPLIAGAAAALWHANPEKTNMEIFRAIQASSSQYENPDDKLGYGIPNFGVADMILKNTDLNTYYQSQELKIYPNPIIENEFYIDYFAPQEGTITIEITSVKGKRVQLEERKISGKSMQILRIELNKKMGAGVYICSINDGAKTFTAKFVKN